MGEFRMPSLGADMDAGRVVEWRVAPGDRVERGQIVAVVETDKADIDVEVFESGVVEALLVGVGEKVPVGTPLATIGASGGGPPECRPAPVLVASTPSPPAPAAPSPVGWTAPEPVAAPGLVRSPLVRRLAADAHLDLGHVHGSGPGGCVTRLDVERALSRPRCSPRARRLARELGVDLAGLAGHGPGGAVVGDDVLAAVAAAPVAAPARPPDRGATMRQAIARLMARSAREVPHYHLALDVDVSGATAWLAAENEARPVTRRLLPAALLLKAVARAARDVPALNGWWEDDAFRPAEGVHLGVAVALRTGGLVAPAIHGADDLSLDELMAALRDLVARARSGHLRGSEVTGASLTVTNLGDLGADSVHGVIYPPQVALVGFGRISRRPWVADDGGLEARDVVTATLAGDHRASDGLVGARFLDALARHLHHPEEC